MDKIIKHGWHWEFGWLRRPEMDQEGLHCYEEPDGDLVMSAHPAHSIAMYLDCRKDEETGELYTCIARIPKKSMKHDPSTKPATSGRDTKR